MKALPETWLCIECSREIGGDFKVVAVPVNTAKPGSIKKNYGSWTIHKTRRTIIPKTR